MAAGFGTTPCWRVSWSTGSNCMQFTSRLAIVLGTLVTQTLLLVAEPAAPAQSAGNGGIRGHLVLSRTPRSNERRPDVASPGAATAIALAGPPRPGFGAFQTGGILAFFLTQLRPPRLGARLLDLQFSTSHPVQRWVEKLRRAPISPLGTSSISWK